MTAIKEQLAAWRAALWAWLMKHAFTVIGVVLACLFLSVVFSGKKSQDVKEVAEHEHQQAELKDKQVKQKDKVIAQRDDTIKTKTAETKVFKQKADSAVALARRHDARADSAVKKLVELSDADPDAAPARLSESLLTYRPGAFALPLGDSLK